MSTVSEIETAIEHLSAPDVRRLMDWLLSRRANAVPKTGAELAKLWPTRFHLPEREAEALAADLDDAHSQQSNVKPSAWE